MDKTNVTDPDCGAKVKTTEPTKTVICEPRRLGRPAVGDNCARGTSSSLTSELDQLFEKILPASSKLLNQVCRNIMGIPLEYSKIKAASIVEVDKKEVYDDTEKLKFLLDAIECRG